MKPLKPLFVTQPSLPPLEELVPYLDQIWQNRILTNNGPFHQQCEQALCDYLGVKHISLFNNGTIALIAALKALGINGEVITTPYSFVATAHSIQWNGLRPVFVDIDRHTFNIDPAGIAAAITPQTSAIMPVHCYGRPCDVTAIQAIADAHGLKVIYDAAHAFGVRNEGQSLLNHGDLSVLSFHATKVFNTFEGGAIVSGSADIKQHIDRLKNFGYAGETEMIEVGINGKMSEFNAALGLLQLKRLDAAIRQRQMIDARYREELAGIEGIHVLPEADKTVANYSYFPILVQSRYPLGRDALYQKLKDRSIFARRYFYPLISDFPMYKDLPSAVPANLPNARDIASKVLCLPLSANMTYVDVDRVVSVIRGRIGGI